MAASTADSDSDTGHARGTNRTRRARAQRLGRGHRGGAPRSPRRAAPPPGTPRPTAEVSSSPSARARPGPLEVAQARGGVVQEVGEGARGQVDRGGGAGPPRPPGSSHSRPSSRRPVDVPERASATARRPACVDAGPASSAQASVARQVGVVRLQAGHSRAASGTVEPGGCGLGLRAPGAPGAAAAGRGPARRELGQPLRGVLPHRLLQPVPRAVRPGQRTRTGCCRPARPARRRAGSSGSAPAAAATIAEVRLAGHRPEAPRAACWAGLSSAWLQSTTPRIVRCRSGQVRRAGRQQPQLAVRAGRRIAAGSHQPAAGGGELDRQRQAVEPDADLGQRRSVRGVDDEVRTRTRRSGRRTPRTAAERSTCSGATSPGPAARGPGTGCSCSPRRRSGDRLVDQRPERGHPCAAGRPRRPPAPSTCSKLSRTSRAAPAAQRHRDATSTSGSSGALPTSRTAATAGSTCSGSARPRAARRRPHRGGRRPAAPATSTARLVLPVPPGPVRVTSAHVRPAQQSARPRRSRPRARRAGRGGSGSLTGEPRGPRRRGERRVLGEDPPLQVAQLRARDRRRTPRRAAARPRGRSPARRSGTRCGTGRASGDPRAARAEGAPATSGLELRDEPRVAAAGQLGLDPVLQRGDALVDEQPVELGAAKSWKANVRQRARPATAQRLGVAAAAAASWRLVGQLLACRRDQAPEAQDVDVVPGRRPAGSRGDGRRARGARPCRARGTAAAPTRRPGAWPCPPAADEPHTPAQTGRRRRPRRPSAAGRQRRRAAWAPRAARLRPSDLPPAGPAGGTPCAS